MREKYVRDCVENCMRLSENMCRECVENVRENYKNKQYKMWETLQKMIIKNQKELLKILL